MTMPDYFEFCCKVNIIADHNALEKIPDILIGLNASNPMIITDKGVSAAGLADIVINSIKDRTHVAAVEDDVPPDSDLNAVRSIASVYRQKKCDAIIAVGGGSVLDTAKGVNILVSENAKDLMHFTGAGALKRRLKPLIAVPTTAGTGSEVTLVAVIADHEKKRKMLFTSYFLLPDAAIIDPRMTLTLPSHITAATAMDAMSHAVESTICLARNPLSDAYAFEAIELISTHIMTVIKNPDDADARLALGTAATMAGAAFSNSMVGMVHTLGHSVGSVCHVPHGTCMAIFLPYGLEYNMHRVQHRIARLLLPLAGELRFAQTPEDERAKETVRFIRQLNLKLREATNGLHATNLSQVTDRHGNPMVTEDMLPQIARTALGDGTVFYNPEDLDYEDCLMILEAAFSGEKLNPSLIKKG